MHSSRLAAAILLFALVTASQLPAQPASNPPSAGEIDRRVQSILSQMSLEEKIDYVSGVDGFFVRDVPRLHVPRLKMADGPVGVRNFGPATAMAAGIGLAASWNPALAERVGVELGRDARAKGVHFLLGPGVNIYREPMNGRNFEYFGEDPFLAGRIAVGYIKGVQSQGVSATVKHFIGNNSEYDRHNTDSVIDDRTVREIYLPAFEAAVKEAHVGAVMTSYNLTNGVHMSQNGVFNIDVLRKDWGFPGILMSDWTSTYDSVGVANGGLDLEMPSGLFLNRQTLMPAIEQGKVSVATLDEKVRHILRLAVELGWLDRDQTDLTIPRLNLKGKQVALEAARESAVLLKNEGPLLPLDRKNLRTVAIIGPGADPAVPAGGGSARVEPFASVSLLTGLAGALGPSTSVLYHRGLPTLSELMDRTSLRTAETGGERGLTLELFDKDDFSTAPRATQVAHIDGDAFSSPPAAASRWTGYFTPREAGDHEVLMLAGGERSGYRLYIDGAIAIDSWDTARALMQSKRLTLSAGPHKVVIEQQRRRHQNGFRFRMGIVPVGGLVAEEAKALAAKADAVVIAVGFDAETESEGGDRTFALPIGQDELIAQLAALNKATVVVVTSGGGIDMTRWIDHVPAVLEGWYAGQEGGTAAAEILLGDTNPSGRLPATFEKRPEDNPAFANYYPEPGTRRVPYREGVFVGYRGYEHNQTKPLFAFGHGLSYTTFKYSNLSAPARTADGRIEIAFDVTNTGSRAGADVAQVYVSEKAPKLPRPPKELKAFSKVSLQPGETKQVTVALDPRAFSYYDVRSKEWRAEAGDFEVLVGHASDAIDLRANVRLAKALLTPR